MARAAYADTIASISADGTLKAISNVKVEARRVSDNGLVNLYSQRSGGSTIGTSLTTGPTGLVEFYIEADEYNITYTDLNAPARIASPRTFGWDAVPGSQNPEALGFAMGDLKLSSVNSDHGRWLKLNGRELTQAEIESALGLAAGDALPFVSYMGTGSSSKYGAAASSKVKLPDTRRRLLGMAGPSGDTTPSPPAGTTARDLGAAGGVETVTLTKTQSGLPTHGHSVTDPGHGHTSPAHDHTVDPHNHSILGTTDDPGPHEHQYGGDSAGNTNVGSGTGQRITSLSDGVGGSVDRYTTGDGGHTHVVTGGTNDVTVNVNTTAATINANSTGLTVVNHAGADASASHENMPPFVTVGYLFIRV